METWEKLLEKAVKYIRNSGIPENTKSQIHWSFGGGTVMMLEYQHRISKDVDIFFNNPQYLGFLSPRLNDSVGADVEFYDEQSEYIKLQQTDGEIDFIVAGNFTNRPHKILRKFDTDIYCEDPIEIMAKKVNYRHKNFTARDFFDLATMIHYSSNEANLIADIIAPYAKTLSERLKNLQTFEGLKTLAPLPKGEVIVKLGKEIVEAFIGGCQKTF